MYVNTRHTCLICYLINYIIMKFSLRRVVNDKSKLNDKFCFLIGEATRIINCDQIRVTQMNGISFARYVIIKSVLAEILHESKPRIKTLFNVNMLKTFEIAIDRSGN